MEYIPCQLLFKSFRYFIMGCSSRYDEVMLECVETSCKLAIYFFGKDVSRHCRERFKKAVEEYKNNINNRKKAWLLFNKHLSHIIDYELNRKGVHRADPLEIIESLYNTRNKLGL